MKRFTEYLSGSAAVLFQVALTGWMFALSRINFNFVFMELNYVLISAVMLGAYYINSIVMRRGMKVPLFVTLQLLLLAAGIFAFVKSIAIEPYELRTVIINCIIYCLGFAVAAYLSWMPTNHNGVLLRFDALAIMIVVMLTLDHVIGMPGAKGCLNMCYVSMALTLLSAVSIKSGALLGRGSAVEGNGAFGKILLGVVAAIAAGIALLVIVFAAGEVKSFSEFLLNILSTCLNALKTAFLWFFGLLERFFLWLSQFMDDSPMEAVGAMPMGGGVGDGMEEVDVTLPGWLWVIPAAIALGVIVFIAMKLRKHSAVRIQTLSRPVVKARRESGLADALRALWAKLKTELLFRWNCLSKPNSAPALLVYWEKKAPGELKREAGESGEAFLLRLSALLDEGERESLMSLAGYVERSFYSPTPESVPRKLAKEIRKLKLQKIH